MNVQIVYALPEVQHTLNLALAEGSTVADALALAEQDLVFSRFPLRASTLGIWGEVTDFDRVLADGDRLEVYRPLLVDPKTARQRRAARQAET